MTYGIGKNTISFILYPVPGNALQWVGKPSEVWLCRLSMGFAGWLLDTHNQESKWIVSGMENGSNTASNLPERALLMESQFVALTPSRRCRHRLARL